MYHPAGLGTYTLAGSISSTVTSITLSSFKVPITNTDVTMATMDTTVAYGTISPGAANAEFISFTGITQNANGTATLTGVTRGLNKESPYTSSSSFKRPHSGQALFILSNSPNLYDKFSIKENDETFSGLKTFSTLPDTTAGNPTTDNQFARKAYVDSVATGGTTTNRVVVAGTAGETVAAGNLVYIKAADGRWWLCDADTAATVDNVQLGIAQGAGTAGNSITNGVLTYGLDTNQTGLTANTTYYASNTAGAISSTPGTVEVTVGFSQSTTSIFFDPRFNQQLTEDQQDALAGTSGTPSSSNKYVTDADTSATASGSKVMRWNAGAYPAGNGAAITNIPLGTTLTAAESITAGQPVTSYFYQSDGGPQYDNKITKNNSFVSTGGTDTTSFTVGSNSNRALVVFVHAGTTAGTIPAPTVTYNGVSMTAVTSQTLDAQHKLFAFILLNPASGANNIATTIGSTGGGATIYISVAATSYYNIGSLDSSAGAVSNTVSYTNPPRGSILASGAGGATTATTSANNFNNLQNSGANTQSAVASADSGIVGTTGNATVTYGGSPSLIIVLGLNPFSTPTYDAVVKSSTSTPANGVNLNKYTTFAGFAQSTVSAGQTLTVITNGAVSGMSGLTPLTQYFLQDSAGTIGTSAGTNSKKIGYSSSATMFILKDTI